MTEVSTDIRPDGAIRVHLDRAKCRAYGICVGLAPDVFELPKGSPAAVLHRQVIDEEDREDVEEAVFACPAQALSLSGPEDGS